VSKTFPLLLEIGCEELPSSFVDAAMAAMPDLLRKRLAELRISHGEVKALGSPRRLALLAHEVAERQTDLDEEVVGPPETAAFKDGKPTKAAEAFATKLGIALDALSVKELAAGQAKKPGRYVVGRQVAKGRPSVELLGEVLSHLIPQIPFRKSMRWGALEATFGRPVQWLVALAGTEVIDVTFAGTRSGRETRGHRFLAPDTFPIRDALAYVDQLRTAHVLVDRDERAKYMMDRVEKAARDLGGVHDPDVALVDESASLVEEPHIVVGSFDEAFLALPPAVIRAVARGHQKYFCVMASHDDDAALLPHYLTVANTANNPAKVAKGNDGVMRARLSDARFFFEEDKKVSAETRVEKLSGIVFHNRLGTVREKVARIEKLAEHLSGLLGLAAANRLLVARAAHLSKNDLVALTVGEFPELQGTMGRAYAMHAGEPQRVADAVRDHWKPVGGDAPVATDDVARIVAVADRIDSLVGCFAVGLSPTGAADPFALRRACIAYLRTVLEGTSPAWASIHFGELVRFAHGLLAGKKLELGPDETVKKLEDFTAERLRGLLETQTSRAVADAVLAGNAFVRGIDEPVVMRPAFAMAKARALQAQVDEKAPWLEKARTVAKRLAGISKEARPEPVARDAFTKDTDATIVDVVVGLDEKTASLVDEKSVREALQAMGSLAEQVDAIFVSTLVNDPEDTLTPLRLSLLSYGASCMLRIADFSRLA
jgi:glycyl-tRNA synthetase beta chain